MKAEVEAEVWPRPSVCRIIPPPAKKPRPSPSQISERVSRGRVRRPMKSMMAAAMPNRAKPVRPALNQVFTPGMSFACRMPRDLTSGKLRDQKTVVSASMRTARKCCEVFGESAVLMFVPSVWCGDLFQADGEMTILKCENQFAVNWAGADQWLQRPVESL